MVTCSADCTTPLAASLLLPTPSLSLLLSPARKPSAAMHKGKAPRSQEVIHDGKEDFDPVLLGLRARWRGGQNAREDPKTHAKGPATLTWKSSGSRPYVPAQERTRKSCAAWTDVMAGTASGSSACKQRGCLERLGQCMRACMGAALETERDRTHRQHCLLMHMVPEPEAAEAGKRHCTGEALSRGAAPDGHERGREGQEGESEGRVGSHLGQDPQLGHTHLPACRR